GAVKPEMLLAATAATMTSPAVVPAGRASSIRSRVVDDPLDDDARSTTSASAGAASPTAAASTPAATTVARRDFIERKRGDIGTPGVWLPAGGRQNACKPEGDSG